MARYAEWFVCNSFASYLHQLTSVYTSTRHRSSSKQTSETSAPKCLLIDAVDGSRHRHLGAKLRLLLRNRQEGAVHERSYHNRA